MTKEQILAELGISREQAAECERLAALSRTCSRPCWPSEAKELIQKIGTSTKASGPG